MVRRSLALVISTVLLVASQARAGIAAEKAAWETRFGPSSELVQRHSVTARNESALLLDELAARLRFPSLGGPTREYREWYRAELSNTRTGRIPLSVLAWHAEKAAMLDELRGVALTREPPVWPDNPCVFTDDDVAAAGILLELPDALTADALVARWLGDEARAESDLEAAWLLVTAQLRRGSVLTAERCSDMAARIGHVVPRLSSPSPAWSSRLDAAPFRAAFAEGMRLEAWCRLTKLETGWSPDADADMTDRWLSRRDALHAIRADRLIVEALFHAPECGVTLRSWRDLSILGMAFRLPDSLMTLGACMELGLAPDSQFGFVACKADRVGISFEAIRRVLALREAAGESGFLPLELPGGSGSTSCPHRSWQWSTDGITGCLEYVQADVPPSDWLDCLWPSESLEYTVQLP